MNQRDVYRTVVDDFNRQKLIPQEALLAYFSRSRILIMEAVVILIGESDHIQRSIANLTVNKISKLDHHRVLFKRSATLPLRKGVSSKVRKKYELTRLLEQTMDLIDGQTSGNLKVQTDVIMNLALTRSEFEGMLNDADEVARQYIEAHDELIRKSKLGKSSKEEKASMKEIEHDWSIGREAAYGLFRMIIKRLDGVRHLYGQVFNAYSRLLIGVANATSNRDHVMDTIQDGAPGLWYSISSYDQNAPSAFPAYARWWIRQQALHHMKSSFNMIRPSLGLWQQGLSFERARRTHETQYGSLSQDEVPASISLSTQQLAAIQRHKMVLQVGSLDATVSPDAADKESNTLTVHSSLGDQEKQEEMSEAEDKQTMVRDLLGRFDPVTRRLVCYHFGLWEYLDEQNLSKTLVLRERIRQILAGTLRSKGRKNDN